MYGFYSKNDPNQEIVFKTNVSSKKKAFEHFCFLKQMTKDQFNKLYEVIEIK